MEDSVNSATLRNNLIREYHNKGYPYSVIVDFLANRHLIIISLRQLKRILKKMGLKRRNIPESSLGDMLVAVLTELTLSGCCLGYKILHKRLQQTYGLHIKQKTVLHLLNILDPVGIERRKSIDSGEEDTLFQDLIFYGTWMGTIS